MPWLRARWAYAPGETLILGFLAALAVLFVVTVAASVAYGPDRVQAAVCGRAGCWGG